MESDNKNNNTTSEKEGVPKLCHVIKSPKFDGYGFNLHAEKSKPGQYIGKVDDGSPAEAAGLREGDRILEVNGVSIANDTHKQVVQRIKSLPNETKLLVVTPQCNGDSKMMNNKAQNGDAKQNGESVNGNGMINGKMQNDDLGDGKMQNEELGNNISLKLNMTAAELRAQLANKKKYDPKKETIDFKKKFDIVQKL